MQRTARRFRIAGGLIAALVLLAVGLLFWQLRSSQQAERALDLEQTEARASQLAAAVASRIDVLVRSIDFALLEVVREFPEYGAESAEFRRVAESLLKSFPEDSLLQLSIADAEGTLTYSSLGLAGRISIRDREHFTAHLDGGDRLFISKPVLGRVSNRWSIQFSRPLLRGGRFAGVAVMSISPEHLGRVLASFRIAQEDNVGLFDEQGTFISYNRKLAEVVGKTVSPARPFMQPDAPARGVYRAASFTDGRDRLFGWERVPGTPLVASIGIDVETARAPQERLFRQAWTRAGPLAAVLLAFGAVILVLFGRLSRQQQVLAASEARFRDFAGASGDWFWETDAEGRFIWISPQMEERIGYMPKQCLGRRRIDVVAEGLDLGAEPWKSHLETLARREPFRDLVYRRQTPKGMKWIRAAGVPYFDVAGAFVGYRGSASDVTAALEAEERLHGALENLDELIALTDAGDRMVFANRSFREFNAAVAEHLAPGRPYVDHLRAGIALGLLPDATGNEEAWIAERMALRRNPGAAVERRRHDGRWLLVRDQRLPDGGVISFGIDITERKRVEAALRRSEEQFRVTFEQAPVGMALRGLDGRWIDANPKLCEILGYRREELLGRTSVEVTPEEERATAIEYNERIRRGLLWTYSREKRYQRKDGTPVWVRLTVNIVKGPDGKPDHLISVIQDISERKRAEQLAQVEHAVTRSLAEAATAHAGLQAIMEALCGAEGWGLAEYWACDESAGAMHRITSWVSSQWPAASAFVERSHETVFRRGEGLPGSVWQSAEPLWVEDLQSEPRMLRKEPARDAGMRGALLAPVLAAGQVIGVLMFMSRELRAPDARLQETIAAIGHQIGQFVQRRRAEDALHEQTERLRIGQSVARMIVMDWDIRKDEIQWSDSPFWLRGPVPADTGQYPPYSDQIHPEDRERFLAERARAIETLEGATHQYRIVRTDGEVRWILSRQMVFAGLDGKAARMLVALHEITGEKRKEALLTLEHRLTHGLAAATDLRQGLLSAMRLICEAEGWECGRYFELGDGATALQLAETWGIDDPMVARFIEWSRGLSRRHGEGIIGIAWQTGEAVWSANVNADPRVRDAEKLSEMGIHGTFAFPLMSEGRTLGVLTFSSRAMHEPDAGLQQLLGSFGRQIGQFIERKRAENETRVALEHLRLATEVARTYSWIWEVETDTLTYLTSAEPLLGPLPASGRYPDFRDMVHPEDRPAYVAMSRQIVAQLVDYEREFRVVRTDGATRWLLGRGSAYRDQFRGKTYMAGVTTDITERKQAEAEIRALNASLEQRVEARTAELQAMLRELESFSYSVSHDLRAPARAVAGFARIVSDDYGAQLPEEAARLLARISRAGETMGAMVDGLLELSRLTRTELQRRPVDLVPIAAEVWRDLAALEPARRMEFHLDAEIRAEGDPVLLRNLLLNLLGNARKYSRERSDAAVWFGRTAAGEFYVRDNGVGFDMHYAAKLFGAFQRLHTEREFEGHGIGLALARKIVERHGGRIRAESEPGRGARFYFTLGAEAARAAAQAPPPLAA